MPNVELPVVAEQDFYSIYFSRGVLLEAQLMAFQLLDKSRRLSSRRVIQVFREDDVGKLAAASLGAAMAGAESEVVNRTIAGIDPKQELVRILADWKSDDALILWLRPGDLILLPPGIKGDKVFMSGLMGGMEHAPLSAGWHRTVRMAYPFDLPERRQVGMNFPLGWFRIRHIKVVDERVQSDTYLACRILSESMGDMLESFFRDYLVEQIETMLSKRLVNGYYPRLGLAPGQRFASKGGYIVRFAADDGTHLIADSDWIVP
jgi:hypothetical protein